ncbi:MAG: alpha/beta hydrolase [Candidatus Methylacidiphilales bacterium]|nr:alpha/beta hydrolase [Candidatus Methylacidiphilales bacterium]
MNLWDARDWAKEIFRRSIPRRTRGCPAERGVFEFGATAQDGELVAGWAWGNTDLPYGQTPNGTLFFLHGYTDSSGNNGTWTAAFALARKFGLCLMAHDSRHHGRSGNRFPTFGTAEMWDFQAALSEAERLGFPQPYIAVGDSLGAMGAQRTAICDSRVRGAFLIHPPAWPYDAIAANIGPWLPAGAAVQMGSRLINAHYGGWDILGDGDLRRHPSHPAHEPLILYVMGTHDRYDWQKTFEIYQHWYRDRPDLEGYIPCREPGARKWFVLVPHAQHPEPAGSGYHVWSWGGYGPILEAFIHRCLHHQRDAGPFS